MANEVEQFEGIRRFFVAHGRKVFGATLIAVLFTGILGYLDVSRKKNQDIVAGELFDLGNAIANEDLEAVQKHYETILSIGADGVIESASLAVARFYFLSGNLDAAISALDALVKESQDEGLKHIARLRMATIMLDQKKYEEIIIMLEENMPVQLSLRILAEELIGDALVAQGDLESGRDYYRSALRKLLDQNVVGADNYRGILFAKLGEAQRVEEVQQ